jgi:uncharacterized protein (TIGR00369 family)
MDPLPFAELLGIELVSASPDSIVAELTVREDLCTLGSAIHGGVMMAFADTLGALGTVANLKEGAGTTTIESKTNFLGAAPAGIRLRAEATPVHRASTSTSLTPCATSCRAGYLACSRLFRRLSEPRAHRTATRDPSPSDPPRNLHPRRPNPSNPSAEPASEKASAKEKASGATATTRPKLRWTLHHHRMGLRLAVRNERHRRRLHWKDLQSAYIARSRATLHIARRPDAMSTVTRPT